jgi:anthranilate synthase component 1
MTKNSSFVVSKEIPSDLLTTVAVFHKIQQSFPKYNFLLESVEKGRYKSQYSAIGFDPDIIWKCQEGRAFISKENDYNNFIESVEHPIKSLKDLINQSQIEDKELPAISSGIFGYMSYDMVKLMEKLPNYNLKDEINIPDSIFIRPQVLIVFDNISDTMQICCPIYQAIKENEEELIKSAIKKIDVIWKIISAPSEIKIEKQFPQKFNFKHKVSKEKYCQMVMESKKYIKDGDIFQILPSQKFEASFNEKNSLAFYRSLRSINPSPALFYFKFEDFCLIGSSPEIMVSLNNKKLTIRPLAGTRKRGKNLAEDVALEKELLQDKKELAEHLMLIDLGRNDIGRVCKKNSITVPKQMVIERYSHVMHISSTVEGEICDEFDALDALVSAMPAGTVSGAPKIRAMEIIEEIEEEKRGFYSGCVGYFSGNGDMETAITLRSALVKNGKIHFQSGAGVVHDSIAEKEYEECLTKVEVLKKALNGIYKYL